MRAKFVNEKFSEEGDPIKDMRIGSSIPIIHQWFKTWAPRAKYTIDDDLNIRVGESLFLQETPITELPDNLRVEGDLDLRRTDIIKLPDNLSVGRSLYLAGAQITKLPDNLKVGEDLGIRGTKITKLPKDLKVGRDIYKDF